MDCRIVVLLAMAVTSCACYPEPVGPWTLQPKCQCGRIYMPVCGSDGQSYSNMCEFECTATFFQYFFGKHMYVVKDDNCDDHPSKGKKLN